MTQAVGTVLPLALAVAVFPVPVIASVLLVGSPRGRLKCAVFVVSWCVGLAAVAAVALLLSDATGAEDDGEPARWVSGLLLALGLVCVAASVRKWRARPRRGEEAATPGWMRTIDEFSVGRAGLAGVALTALNPKNVALTAAAAAEVAAFGLPAEQQIATLVAFVGVASVGVALPLALSLVLGPRSADVLDRLRGWMSRNNAVIMAALFLLIGLKLIGDAVLGFA